MVGLSREEGSGFASGRPGTPFGCRRGLTRGRDEQRRAAEKAARDRGVCGKKVANLEQQLGHTREEAQQTEHRVTDAEEALALAEQRLRAAQVRLDEQNSGLSA